MILVRMRKLYHQKIRMFLFREVPLGTDGLLICYDHPNEITSDHLMIWPGIDQVSLPGVGVGLVSAILCGILGAYIDNVAVPMRGVEHDDLRQGCGDLLGEGSLDDCAGEFGGYHGWLVFGRRKGS
jgi:hypothetical protein